MSHSSVSLWWVGVGPRPQHGSSLNIEPLPVCPATFTTEHFATVSSLPVRHWQTAMQASIRPLKEDPLPFPTCHHGRKRNDAPFVGGVTLNKNRGFKTVIKHSGLHSAKSGKTESLPSMPTCKFEEGLFDSYFPPLSKPMDRRP